MALPIDPTTAGGRVVGSGVAKVAGWAQGRVRAHRAIGRAIKAAGLDSGTYRMTVKAWLKNDGNRQLAQGDAAASLTDAIKAKTGDNLTLSDETIDALQANLFRELDELANGTWVAQVDTSRHDELVAAVARLHSDLVETDLAAYCTIREGKKIVEWISDHDDWASLESHLDVGKKRPPYGRRNVDSEIDDRLYGAALAEGDLWSSAVVLSGISKCGKTRSLLQAISRFVQDGYDVKVIQPRHDAVMDTLSIINNHGISPSEPDTINVVLIYDLQFVEQAQKLLGKSTLLDVVDQDVLYPRLLEFLHTPDEETVVVAVTSWPSIVRDLETARQGDRNAPILDRFKDLWVEVDPEWTEEEFADLDADLRGQLVSEAKGLGATGPVEVASLLAARPILRKRFEDLSDVKDAERSRQDRDVARLARTFMCQALTGFALQQHRATADDLRAAYKQLTEDLDVLHGFDAALRWASESPVGTTWAIALETEGGFRLADFLWELGAEHHGQPLLDNASYRDNLTPDRLLRIAVTAYQLDQTDLTRQALRLAAASESDEAPSAMVNLGFLEKQDGDLDEARNWYGQAIDIGHPDHAPAAMFNLGLLEKQAGDLDEARNWYGQAIDIGHPDHAPAAMFNLGLLEYEAGDLDEARNWYGQAIDIGHPDHAPRAMVDLGVLEDEAGNMDEARNWYGQAIGTGHPDHAPRAMASLGLLEKQAGDLDEARNWYGQAIDTGHPDHAPRAMFNLGLLEDEAGDLDEARNWYGQAIDTGHTDHAPRAMVNLGVLEDEAGNLDEARNWYGQAIDTGHTDVAQSARVLLEALDS